jgi:DMSO reductase family type II enzyme chaperone
MSRDTIIGKAPSGTLPGPDGIVPGEERAGVDTEESASEHASNDADEPTAQVVPGDASTAFHRSRVYSLLALGFERPGEDFQRAIEAGAFPTDLVESAGAIDDDVAETARTVETHLEDADGLHDEWASLFGVEEGVTVSPYELTYLPGPLMTNVRKLADLSGFYEAFDLEIVPEKNDRRDHVCFLLEFLGQLSIREAYLRLEGDDEGVAIVGNAYRQFLEEHLGRWYWRFVNEVSQHDDGFYATLGDLLAALVESEIDRLGVEPEWVPDDPQVTEWTEDVFGESGRGCGGCGVNPGEHRTKPTVGSDPDTRQTGNKR